MEEVGPLWRLMSKNEIEKWLFFELGAHFCD